MVVQSTKTEKYFQASLLPELRNLSVGEVRRRLGSGSGLLTPRIISNVAPFAMAGRLGILAKGAKFFKGAATGGMAALRSLGELSIKQRLANIGLTSAAIGLASYSATGEIPTLSKRTIAGVASVQLNPIGALVGGATSLTKLGFEKIKSSVPSAIPFVNYSPYIPAPDISRFRDYFPEGGAPSSTINIEGGMATPQPTNISLPSFSFVAGGGGGLDPMTMALLVALVAGGTGYALGRKRRKKRYKKRKRYD